MINPGLMPKIVKITDLEVLSRMKEIGIPADYFTANKAKKFLYGEWCLVVRDLDPFTKHAMLVCPRTGKII